MEKAVYMTNKMLFYGFLALGIMCLVFNIFSIYTMLIAFASFIASWLILLVLRAKKISPNYMILINIALWFNILGEIVFYYNSVIPYYDKILHFFVPMLITAIMYSYYSKSLKPKKDMVFFTVLGMLTIWEIGEWVLMTYFGFPLLGVYTNGVMMEDPLTDTFIDLIMGCLGSISYLFFKTSKPK